MPGGALYALGAAVQLLHGGAATRVNTCKTSIAADAHSTAGARRGHCCNNILALPSPAIPRGEKKREHRNAPVLCETSSWSRTQNHTFLEHKDLHPDTCPYAKCGTTRTFMHDCGQQSPSDKIHRPDSPSLVTAPFLAGSISKKAMTATLPTDRPFVPDWDMQLGTHAQKKPRRTAHNGGTTLGQTI